jgi:ATP/maltotriose-dependent transcriptional regulator MalT
MRDAASPSRDGSEDSGQATERIRRRHAVYFLGLAEEAEPELKGARQEAWLGHLEHDNFRGLINAQVAEQLFISPRTVNAHLGSVYHKIGSSTRAEAARFATEHGLL